ncbi:MAG: hypothetical protein WCR72_07325 [Bacteroidota bacterium]
MGKSDQNILTAELQNESPTEKYYAALKAYVCLKKRGDIWPMLPQRADSLIGKKTVKLRTGCFLLAVYDSQKREIIKTPKS